MLFVLKRTALRSLQALFLVVATAMATLWMLWQLPGDFAYRIAVGRYGYDLISSEAADAVRNELNLPTTFLESALSWLGNLFTLGFGKSLVSGSDALAEAAQYLGNSAVLAVTGVLISVILSLALAWVCLSERRYAALTARAIAVLARSTHPFLVGLALILVLAVSLGWFPSGGHGKPVNIVLPAATVAIPLIGKMTLIFESELRRILTSGHVSFARQRGVKGGLLIARHVSRNAAIAVVGFIGASITLLLESMIVSEFLFGWPGLGHSLVHSIFWRDYVMLQASVSLVALVAISLRLVTDLSTHFLKHGSRSS